MAPAHIPVFLSQKPSAENGINRPAILFLAWLLQTQAHGLFTGLRHHVGGLIAELKGGESNEHESTNEHEPAETELETIQKATTQLTTVLIGLLVFDLFCFQY